MAPVLEKLLVLQERDSRHQRITKELERLPLDEKAVTDKLAVQTREFEARKLKAKQVESRRKDLDNQVLSKRDTINRYKTQQFQTKKNEEFQALTIEIERAEKEIIGMEDEELELMEAYETAQKEVAAEGTRVKEFEQAAAARKADLKQKAEVLQQQLAEVTAQIAEAEKEIDAPSLSLYRRILKSKGDAAIVQVQHGNNCGGCHMTLTQQTILLAKAGQKLTTCENCGRVLYWQSEFA